MAAEKCRNCDGPLKGNRFCPQCGADSEAKRFSREDDLVAENERLKAEIEKKKGWQPPAAPNPGGDDASDI